MEKIEKIIFAGKRAICREPMAAAILQREHLNFPVEILARGIVVLFPEPLNQKAEAVMISNGITLENYMSSQLEPSDFGEHTLVLTFDQAAKEKVLEMEGAQNVEVLTELTGDELTESIQSASESLRSAEISMQNQQDNMSNYTITSPISGTIIEKDAKQGDALTSGSTLCVIYDLSYLEMVINVDELQIGALSVGQKVQLTADAVTDKTYVGTVTRVSMKGDTSGGTTTYPVTVRIDETDGLRPGMNANAEIVVAQAKNALTVPNAAIVRGGYVLVRQDSPSAVNADDSMSAPEGYVYVKVKTGVSDDNYTQVTSGLSESDTIAYDPSSVSSDSYYDDGGYDDMDGEVIGGAGNNADLAEGGEETLPEETENGEAPAADAEEPAEGIDPAEAGAVVVD